MFNFFLVTVLFLIIITGFLFFIKVKNRKKMKNILSEKMFNLEMIKHFESYIAVLEYHMNKAYNIIFKDQIMIYSIEAMGVNDDHFEQASRKYIMLVLKMIGPVLQKEFEYLYGNRETFLFNVTEYFHNQYENDEIRKTAQNNLMEDDNKI